MGVRVTVIGAESKIATQISNSDRDYYVHFCANALEKGMNSTFSSSYGLNSKVDSAFSARAATSL